LLFFFCTPLVVRVIGYSPFRKKLWLAILLSPCFVGFLFLLTGHGHVSLGIQLRILAFTSTSVLALLAVLGYSLEARSLRRGRGAIEERRKGSA
jgi:hypothetical protein